MYIYNNRTWNDVKLVFNTIKISLIIMAFNVIRMLENSLTLFAWSWCFCYFFSYFAIAIRVTLCLSVCECENPYECVVRVCGCVFCICICRIYWLCIDLDLSRVYALTCGIAIPTTRRDWDLCCGMWTYAWICMRACVCVCIKCSPSNKLPRICV